MLPALVALSLVVLAGSGDGRAADVPVDLELVLAVDVSGSMDMDEQALQRQGYVAAFLHPDLVAVVRSGPYQRIAATYVEWAGPSSQAVVVPWTLIGDERMAGDFAVALDDAPVSRIRGTSISGALAFSAPLFDGNGFDSVRRVIDVSGDGANNMGPPVVPARDAAVAAGIVINGLPIALKSGSGWSPGGPDLVAYYRDCVIGGPGSFVLPVTAADQLIESIREKLVLEIAAAPGRLVLAADGPAGHTDCLVGERLRRMWERDP